MSNQEDDDRKIINIQAVTRAVKKLGQFALVHKNSECNLLITHEFILNPSAEQFWKIQCKLEAKRLDIWYFWANRELIEDESVKEDEIQLYFDVIHQQGTLLKRTGVGTMVGGDTMLLINGENYVGVKRKYLDMFHGLPVLKQPIADPDHPIIVDEYHLVWPFNDPEDSGICNEYLKNL
jgi:hypothetical protein